MGGPLRLRPTIHRSRTAVFSAWASSSGCFWLLKLQRFAGRLPPGRTSNRNKKKNGSGLWPLHVLYMGPFWGTILVPGLPPHVCSVLVVCSLLPGEPWLELLADRVYCCCCCCYCVNQTFLRARLIFFLNKRKFLHYYRNRPEFF